MKLLVGTHDVVYLGASTLPQILCSTSSAPFTHARTLKTMHWMCYISYWSMYALLYQLMRVGDSSAVSCRKQALHTSSFSVWAAGAVVGNGEELLQIIRIIIIIKCKNKFSCWWKLCLVDTASQEPYCCESMNLTGNLYHGVYVVECIIIWKYFLTIFGHNFHQRLNI